MMDRKTFKCVNCGYIPRNTPISGSWFCPKCGKRMTVSSTQKRVPRKVYPKAKKVKIKSRDQIASSIYNRLTYEKKIDLGFKEPYINPKINSILPKKRSKIKLFFKNET